MTGDRKYRYCHPRTLTAVLLIIALALSIGTAVFAAQTKSNADKIARLQRHDRRQALAADAAQDKLITEINRAIGAARQAEYRICVRQMATRAVIVLDRGHDEPQLPLYDCRPNLVGGSATVLGAAKTRELLARVRAGHAP